MKKLLRISLMLILMLLFLFFSFSASPVITKQNEAYLQSFIKDWHLPQSCDSCHRDFESEVSVISLVQDSVIGQIRHEQVPFCNAGNVEYYYKNRKGFCFDRAILLELFFRYYGFQVRHVFIYYRTEDAKTTSLDFLKRKIFSHAMLEVKTMKGWMAVGTNHNWLGMDNDGNVLDLSMIRGMLRTHSLQLAKNSQQGSPFFAVLKEPSEFKFIYGLYSRHGKFLSSGTVEKWLAAAGVPSFIPDYNIRSLLYNF